MKKKMCEENRMFSDEDIYRFLKDLLDPEIYGWAVTAEVRNKSRELLGLEKLETNVFNDLWE
jgi:hypothetical protein